MKKVEVVNQRIFEMVQNNELSNRDLVSIIENLGSLLNLQTISNYAKDNLMTYNGVKNYRQIVELFKIKFVIDNE